MHDCQRKVRWGRYSLEDSPHIGISVDPAFEPDGVGLQVPPQLGVVGAVVVVAGEARQA